nr:MAG TPA: hypothetical protein [Caudoviricetes sp.]
MEIKISIELRPVKLANGINGLFHTFTNNGNALIETEDGIVREYANEAFRFLDNKFEEFCFTTERHELVYPPDIED